MEMETYLLNHLALCANMSAEQNAAAADATTNQGGGRAPSPEGYGLEPYR